MRNGIGLSGKNPTKTKQKKVNGVVYKVRNRYYGNFPCGFRMFKDGEEVRFHNGKGFDNPFSLDEALNWAIENL